MCFYLCIFGQIKTLSCLLWVRVIHSRRTADPSLYSRETPTENAPKDRAGGRSATAVHVVRIVKGMHILVQRLQVGLFIDEHVV